MGEVLRWDELLFLDQNGLTNCYRQNLQEECKPGSPPAQRKELWSPRDSCSYSAPPIAGLVTLGGATPWWVSQCRSAKCKWQRSPVKSFSENKWTAHTRQVCHGGMQKGHVLPPFECLKREAHGRAIHEGGRAACQETGLLASRQQCARIALWTARHRHSRSIFPKLRSPCTSL